MVKQVHALIIIKNKKLSGFSEEPNSLNPSEKGNITFASTNTIEYITIDNNNFKVVFIMIKFPLDVVGRRY
jgi:hypothetical protein